MRLPGEVFTQSVLIFTHDLCKVSAVRTASGELFPTDSPLPAGQLIGRRDDVREIATRLEAGTHLILAGPRRTGKTSVCEAALARAARRGLYTAKVDLFRA